jgi:negative regulator of sigma E activity
MRMKHLSILIHGIAAMMALALTVSPALGGRKMQRHAVLGEKRLAKARLITSNPEVVALVRQMLVAQNQLTLEGTMVSQTPQGTYTQYAILAGARSQRYDCLSPPANKGEVIVDNGRMRYHVAPSGKVDTTPSQMSARRVRVPQVMKEIRKGQLQVEAVGEGVVAGHTCEIVRITPPYAAEWYQYWIDPTNGAQLRIEQYAASGQRESETYFTDVTYNPSLKRGLFAAPHPTGIAPSASSSAPLPSIPTTAQAGFTVLQPSYLPPGFHFQSSTVTPRNGTMLVKLTYGNGLNALTLVETPDTKWEGRKADQIRNPRPDVVLTRRSGLVIVLVSSLDTGVLKNVISSVH